MSDREQRRLDAIEDFRRARRRAVLEDLLAWLKGEPDDLLAFEEVWRRVGEHSWAARGLHEIPVEAIVGSVGRYSDFTRHFLPRRPSDEARWANVQMLMSSGHRLPPIEVYKLGQVYFVKDGNHRVSVARELGITHLSALVSEVQAHVPLSPDLSPDDLIIASEHASFIGQTHLDELRPGLGLRVTVPGAYQTLAGHIEQRRYQLALREARAVNAGEAATWWYDSVYLPMVALIRELGLLGDFPGRTETDLYVWVSEHQAALEVELSWPVAPAVAASDLAERRSPRAERVLRRAGKRLLDVIRPETVRPGPPPGTWRHEHHVDEGATGLFKTILVPLSGQAEGWRALEQAIIIAGSEHGALYGLHVLPAHNGATAKAAAIQQAFAERCAAAGLPGRMAMDTGAVASRICERARWADIVVVSLAHAPRARPLARLRSGLRDLIQRCPQPLLAVPGVVTPLTHGLLAYDGSRRSEEALMLAAYLALRGPFSLVVVTAHGRGDSAAETVERAQAYLEQRGISARYVTKQAPADEAILAVAEDQKTDLIILGGYSFRPELEIMLGSTVDSVLRASQVPVLVCR
ncbi:MAG: universal stress protein [Chloroflexales bacterium]|nr:universal stress protein [Chloroflexales bacterium]